MNRRDFIGSILAAGFAPAAIGSGVLMPISALAPNNYMVFYDLDGGPCGEIALTEQSKGGWAMAIDAAR